VVVVAFDSFGGKIEKRGDLEYALGCIGADECYGIIEVHACS
jgi:hypothetical protein